MPIYGYQCSACGHQKDALQKLSDPVLTTCPQCQEESFKRQLSAPAFQLKGSGWYVTDFKDGNKPADSASKNDSGDTSSSSAGSEGGSEAKSGSDTKSGSDSKASGDTPAKSTSKTESSASTSSSSSSPAPASGGSSSS